MNCGHRLTAVTADDIHRHNLLTSSTPAPLAKKMRDASKRSGERRVVTSVFADVVGSTSIAENLDPEEWTNIMNKAFDNISVPIYYFEGSIARLMGDAILAFFGAPVAHEDDPTRAILASIELLKASKQFAKIAKKDHGINFEMRVGINTGTVVVGEVGSDLKFEYTAMGDAINLAQRMQAASKPGKILISSETYKFVAPLFDFNDLGMIKVKGKKEEVQVYEIIGPKQKAGKLRGLTSAGIDSPIVGRDNELKTLIATQKNLKPEQGAITLIIGEAGLGKSRLLAEWQSDNSNDDYQWYAGQCLSYGKGLAYHLLIDLLKSIIGISSNAQDTEIKKSLKKFLDDHIGSDADKISPFLGHLLSIKLEDDAKEQIDQIDPAALQLKYLESFRNILIAITKNNKVTLVMEDIHWADPSSIELIIKLLPLVQETSIIFCFLSRPDKDSQGWKIISYLEENLIAYKTDLLLNSLSDEESNQLVENLLRIEAIPETSKSLILQKAEGNPFFVEEVIRMLIDQEFIIRENDKWKAIKDIETIDIPDNLQGLLLARIDRLPEEVKHTLRVASVIGRQFSVQVLEEVLQQEDL